MMIETLFIVFGIVATSFVIYTTTQTIIDDKVEKAIESEREKNLLRIKVIEQMIKGARK